MSFYFPSSSSSCADASRSCSALPTCAERPSAAHFFDMLKQSPVYGHAFLLPPASFLRSELSPIVCMSCHKRGHFICENCYTRLPFISPSLACRNCASPYGWLSCTACDEPWELTQTSSVLELSPLVRRMITDFKDRGELRLAVVIAALMSSYVMQLLDKDGASARAHAFLHPDCVCFVPATKAAYTYRGFDHMELVARLFADVITIPYIDALARPYAADQRALNKQQRMSNLAHSMLVVQPEAIQQKHMLVLDDTLTTGASVIEAARALHEAGAASVRSFTLTRVW